MDSTTHPAACLPPDLCSGLGPDLSYDATFSPSFTLKSNPSQRVLYDSVIKFFVLGGLFSGVVAVSPDSAPNSAFAPSLFARPSGPLPSSIIRCPAGLARLKSSLMPSGRVHSPWPGDPDSNWQASPLRQYLCGRCATGVDRV